MTYSVAGYSGWVKIGRDAVKADSPEEAAEWFANNRLVAFSSPDGTEWEVSVMSALAGCGGESRGCWTYRIVNPEHRPTVERLG